MICYVEPSSSSPSSFCTFTRPSRRAGGTCKRLASDTMRDAGLPPLAMGMRARTSSFFRHGNPLVAVREQTVIGRPKHHRPNRLIALTSSGLATATLGVNGERLESVISHDR